MNTNTTVVKNGVGFFGLLTLLFIALKLTGFISWSWLWVLAPLWLPWAAGLGVALIFGIVACALFLIALRPFKHVRKPNSIFPT